MTADVESPPQSPRSELPWVLAVGAIVAAVYMRLVLTTYGVADDYPLLVTARNVTRTTISAGRPILGLFDEVAFSLAHDVPGLRWIRLLGVIGTVLAAVTLYFVCRAARFSPAPAMVVAVAAVCMPGFQVLTAWAVAATVPYAVALSLGAGLLIVRPAASPQGPSLRIALLSGIALIAALGIYQPTAMCFWPVVVIVTIARLPDRMPSRRFLITTPGIFLAAVVTYYALFRGLAAITGVEVQRRASFVQLSGIRGKVSWFLRDPLIRAINAFELQPQRTGAVIIVAVVLVGVLVRLRTLPLRWRLGALLALGLCIPLAYAPVLATIDNWPAARSRVALELTLVLIAALAAQGYASLLPQSWTRPVGFAVGGIALVGMAAFAVYRTNAYFAHPQEVEYARARRAIKATRIDPERPLYAIRARWRDTLAPARSLDEFGLASTYQPWVPAPLTKLVLREDNRARPTRIVVLSAGTQRTFSRDDRVIDFGAVLRESERPPPLDREKDG